MQYSRIIQRRYRHAMRSWASRTCKGPQLKTPPKGPSSSGTIKRPSHRSTSLRGTRNQPCFEAIARFDVHISARMGPGVHRKRCRRTPYSVVAAAMCYLPSWIRQSRINIVSNCAVRPLRTVAQHILVLLSTHFPRRARPDRKRTSMRDPLRPGAMEYRGPPNHCN